MSDQVNPKKIYVGNLPYSYTDQDLHSLCGEFGEIVEVKLITDRFSGRSKGFAFVEFATEEAANAAIEALNGKEIDGRPLVLTVARPLAPRTDRPFNRGPGGGGGYQGGGAGGYRGGDRGGDRRGGGGYRNDR